MNTVVAIIVLASAFASAGAGAEGDARVVEARAGEVVTLEPPDGIEPESAYWVELSGPSIILRRGEAKGPTLRARPRLGGVYRFACLPDRSASLLRARLFEVRVNEASAAPRAVCPILACAGEELAVQADCTPGVLLKIKAATWKQLSGPRLALTRDELRQTTLRFVPELPGRYRFALKVPGCRGWATFTFEVPRNPMGGPERRPVARVAAVSAARVGEEVVLDGSRSSDPDGGPLVHTWRKVAGPPGSLVAASSGPSKDPTFRGKGARVRFCPALEGEYAFTLTVADPAGFESRPAPVTLTVGPVPELPRPDTEAADPLDRPFSIRLENQPLSVLFARLSDAGVSVRASREVTAEHPLDEFRIDLWVVDLPPRKVLDWLGRMLGAFYVVERPGVLWLARGTRWLEREEAVPQTYRIDALYSEKDASDLTALLRESVRAVVWGSEELSVGPADMKTDTITAVVPASAQARIARVLKELRREVPAAPPESGPRRALARMMRRPVTVRCAKWPLREIIWDLAGQARVPIGFPPLGRSGGNRFSLDLGEVTLGEALDALCRAVREGAQEPSPFADYVAELPGAVWLSKGAPPPETAECLWSAAEVRSYDLGLLRRRHGYSGRMVEHLVRSRVMPERWRSPFVMVGHSAARGRLVVVHHREVQLRVARFLERLARKGDKALAE